MAVAEAGRDRRRKRVRWREVERWSRRPRVGVTRDPWFPPATRFPRCADVAWHVLRMLRTSSRHTVSVISAFGQGSSGPPDEAHPRHQRPTPARRQVAPSWREASRRSSLPWEVCRIAKPNSCASSRRARVHVAGTTVVWIGLSDRPLDPLGITSAGRSLPQVPSGTMWVRAKPGGGWFSPTWCWREGCNLGSLLWLLPRRNSHLRSPSLRKTSGLADTYTLPDRFLTNFWGRAAPPKYLRYGATRTRVRFPFLDRLAAADSLTSSR